MTPCAIQDIIDKELAKLRFLRDACEVDGIDHTGLSYLLDGVIQVVEGINFRDDLSPK